MFGIVASMKKKKQFLHQSVRHTIMNSETIVNQYAATKTLYSSILVATILFRTNSLSPHEQIMAMNAHCVPSDFLGFALQFSSTFSLLVNITTLSAYITQIRFYV